MCMIFINTMQYFEFCYFCRYYITSILGLKIYNMYVWKIILYLPERGNWKNQYLHDFNINSKLILKVI